MNGSRSWPSELSFRLMNTCVVRPLGSLKANATVPRVLETPFHRSSGIVFLLHACATFGSPGSLEPHLVIGRRLGEQRRHGQWEQHAHHHSISVAECACENAYYGAPRP